MSRASIKFKSFIYFLSLLITSILTISYLSLEKIKFSMFESVDRILYSELNLITNFMDFENKIVDLEVSEISTGVYTIPKSGHYYKLIIHNKDIFFKLNNSKELNKIAISLSLQNKNFDFIIKEINYNNPESNEIIYTSEDQNFEPVRVIKKEINFKGVDITVYVAESIKNNLKIIDEFKYFVLFILPLIILLSSLFIILIVNNIITPINKISEEISNINHKNLDKKVSINDYVIELESLIISFNQMLDRVNKAFQIEKNIISEASHKLKTPIAVIKSYCDITLKKERSKEEYIDSILSIKETIESMTSLISGVLSLAKLDSNNLTYNKFENINLSECIKDSLKISKYLASQKNINIKISLSNNLYINGDKEKITDMFTNLIENSIKYNNDNGFINITAEKLNDILEIHIKDGGIGISKLEQSKIFELFYRAENVKNIEGNGLGLNIVKSIIESHQGIIKVNSEIDKGTEFVITFKNID